MTKDLVSIIIPAYNAHRFLTEAVDSALNQSHGKVEVIVVDDGSTDQTRELFPSFEARGVKCLVQPNKGACAARNLGLSHATGEFIQYLDSDDVLHPDKIKLQLIAMREQDADLSKCYWGAFTDSADNVQPFIFKDEDFNGIVDGKDMLRAYGMRKLSGTIHSILAHRDLIEKAGKWNESLANNQDGEYFSRVFIHSKKIAIVRKQLAYHRVGREGSVSKINSIHKIESALKSWDLIYQLMLTQGDPSLLSYPKKGYFVVYLAVRNKFPAYAKILARRFDRIKAPCFLSNWKYNWIVKLFGLYYAPLFYYRLVNLGLIKVTGRHPI